MKREKELLGMGFTTYRAYPRGPRHPKSLTNLRWTELIEFGWRAVTTRDTKVSLLIARSKNNQRLRSKEQENNKTKRRCRTNGCTTYAFDGRVDGDADVVVCHTSCGWQSVCVRPRMVLIGMVLIALSRKRRGDRRRLLRHAESFSSCLVNPRLPRRESVQRRSRWLAVVVVVVVTHTSSQTARMRTRMTSRRHCDGRRPIRPRHPLFAGRVDFGVVVYLAGYELSADLQTKPLVIPCA